MRKTTTRRVSLAGIAAVTSAALLATAAPSATAADDSRGTARTVTARAATQAPELTAEQRQFIEQEMGPEALAEIEKAMSGSGGFAFPIACWAWPVRWPHAPGTEARSVTGPTGTRSPRR
jgi:hypothetical protein